MLTQEAAIQQIHDAKSMVENDLQQKLEEFEEEREQLLKAANKATALERELEEVHTLACTHTHVQHMFRCMSVVSGEDQCPVLYR